MIHFIGALPGAQPRNGVKFVDGQSRCYKQPYRVHGTCGEHPALSANEPMGRYWILEVYALLFRQSAYLAATKGQRLYAAP